MAFGPMPEDRTQVGGLTSSQNDTDTDRGDHDLDSIQAAEDTRNRRAQRQAHIKATASGSERYDDMQPVTQNSPTKVRVPGWRVIVLGSSGGLTVRGYYRD
jgi:hypothetical protein